MMHEELGICEDARFAFGQEATKQLKAKYEISLLCGIQHPEATKNAIAGLAQKIRAGDASRAPPRKFVAPSTRHGALDKRETRAVGRTERREASRRVSSADRRGVAAAFPRRSPSP